MSKVSSLGQLLKNSKCDDNSLITNTRIPDRNLGIYGGKYTINDKENFYKLYHKAVFIEKELEYLTEKQLDAGMITLDFDFKYSPDTEERQHTEDHINDIIEMYLENIKKILNIEPNKKFHIWVFQKDNVNQLEDKTKDGIHILIELEMEQRAQMLLRKKILEECSNVLEDLPLINTYDDILDIGVANGTVNWQVYGSRKPGHEAYKITNTYNIFIDEDGDENIEEIENQSNLQLIKLTSIRRTDLLKFEYNESIKDELVANFTKIKNKKKKKRKFKLTKKNLFSTNEYYTNINTTEDLDLKIKNLLNENKFEDDKVFREMHEFTMLLDERYYEPYDKWLRVGWALRNTDPRLWWTWLKFSSKSPNFSFDNIEEFYDTWTNGDDSGNSELTKYSIMYWAKECDYTQYENIKKNCVEFLLRDVFKGETEYDMAIVLEKLYGDIYKCISITKKIWYQYNNGIWVMTECGNTLRRKLSKNIHDMCKELQEKAFQTILQHDGPSDNEEEDDHDDGKTVRAYCKKIAGIALKLKSTSWKTNIMKEAADIFYDKDFINKIDKNPDLLCFSNGIIDFAKKEFRKGQPCDYVSKCTNIPYIKFDKENPEHIQTKIEIEDFFRKLFPNKSLYKYIWEHLASTLSGRNTNQTFNIYTGEGRNGKSKMAELMQLVLGDYCGQVPITLVTGNRTTIGSLSPEVAQMKGIRYAIMQEPSKGMALNEGVMKQLTGGDDIQGRALYQDTITFKPQFSLVVCTNHLFEVNSSDHGTWRRIRKVDFVSTFNENPSKNPDEYEYKVDKDIDKKFDKWAPILASLLVEKHFETGGEVEDCPIVMESSNEYQQEKDFFGLFISEKISKIEGHSFHRSAVKKEFDDWYIDLYSQKPPAGTELYSYLDHKLGKKKSDKKWHGFALSSYLDQYDSNFTPNHL